VGFNNAKSRRKFEDEWIKLREQYQESGFAEEGIAMMRAFDEDMYRSQRRFEEHNLPLPSDNFDEDDVKNRGSLFGRFKGFTVSFDESSFDGRFSWIETIEDSVLASRLKRLRDDDLELLTLFVIEGYNQLEIARLLGCTHQNVTKKLQRINKKLHF